MESTQRAFRTRRGYVHLAFQAAFVILAVRLAIVQVFHHPWLLDKARRMEADTIVLEPQRGLIIDRLGRPLAVTTNAPSVWANARAVPAERRAEVAAELARLLNVDVDRLAARLAQPKYFVWIKRKVTEEEAAAVTQARLPGVGLRNETVRRYPKGSFLCHVLGFVSVDGLGLEGIEAQYNDALAGIPGEERIQRDGLGREMGGESGPTVPPVHGRSVVLTIDSRIQAIAEEELAAACERHRPESATAVVMDPWTGDILAMAVWPAFDPASFQSVPPLLRRNMAVVECIEPGSTFKPFVAAAAIEHGVVTPDTVFDCHQGLYVIGSRRLRDVHGYGRLSVRDIIAYSSNIGMAQIGMALGPEGIYRSLRAYGFGQKTGVELPGESAGLLHHPRAWSKLTISSIPMGQEVAVSPLQLATGFCIFANGGFHVRPRLVLGLADSHGRTLLEAAPAPSYQRVMSERTAQLMNNDLLAKVVEYGTAHSSAIAGYAMGGKTGTAQLARPDARGYEPGSYSAAFVGIVPVEQPRFVIAVVCKRPRGGAYYGGTVAAPAAAKMGERMLSTFHIPRTPDYEPKKLRAAAVSRNEAARRGHR